MLRRLYDWTLDLAGHRHALWALFFVAVIESSFFIVPPDVLLIPMVLAARNRAWLIAGVCTAHAGKPQSRARLSHCTNAAAVLWP